MTGRSMLRVSLPALVLAGVVAGGAFAAAESGRFKKQGDRCVWDANDSGPNQCMPVTTGRFKKDGDACVWAATETGADQCRPSKGRFKKEGTNCVWNADDGGPDQCDPHKAK